MKNSAYLSLSVVIALALSGCGGSSDTSTTSAPSVGKAGDTVSVTKLVNGHEVLLDTYRFYTLTDSGQFSATPVDNDASLPLFAFLELRQLKPMPVVYTKASSATATVNASPPSVQEMIAFTESLISAYRTYYGGISAQEAAKQLRKLGQSSEDMHADYKASGLGSLHDYIAFYAAVDQYGTDDALMTELDAKHFIDFARMNQAKFLQFLSTYAVTWPELLTQMKTKAFSFDKLQQAYAASEQSLGNYLAGFVHGGTGALGGTLADDNNVVSEAAALGFAVKQYSWYNIDPNGNIQTAAHGYWSDVLSSQDADVTRYNYIHMANTDNVEYIVQNNPDSEYVWTQLADVGFNLQYYYGAMNPSAPNSYWFTLLTLNVNKNNIRGGDKLDRLVYTYHHSLQASITNLSDHVFPEGNSVDVTIRSDFHIFATFVDYEVGNWPLDMHYYDDWEVNSFKGNYLHSSSQSGHYTCRSTDDYDCQSTTPGS
ncbi:MAG: hypothetical protein AB1717_08865 [Pseudomonadota bacterium]